MSLYDQTWQFLNPTNVQCLIKDCSWLLQMCDDVIMNYSICVIVHLAHNNT